MKVSGRLAEDWRSLRTEWRDLGQQFDNVAKPRAHIATTAPEIWESTGGKVDGFICAVGSGGTLAGTAMGLHRFNKDIKNRPR